jgi:hypothetical protein
MPQFMKPIASSNYSTFTSTVLYIKLHTYRFILGLNNSRLNSRNVMQLIRLDKIKFKNKITRISFS